MRTQMRESNNAPAKMITAAPPPPEADADADAAPCALTASARVRRASRGSFATCLGAALALNLVAIGVFASVKTHWLAPPPGGIETSWITATMVEPPTEPPAPNEAPARSTEPPKAADPRRPTLYEVTPQARTLAQVPPSANAAEPEPMRFYTSGEVDRPAEPEPDSDWNLDPAALDAVGVQALVFDIFIGPSGEVIDCEIIEPRSLPEDARLALQQRLKQTVLQPARRHDVAVASVRRIEVSVATPGS